MSSDLLRPHKESETYARLSGLLLFGVTAAAIVASIFLSPLKVLAVLLGIIACYVGFWRPQYLLGFLVFYLPFESTLLKFVGDDIYVFARYFSELLIYLLCVVIIWRLATRQIRWRPTFADLPFVLFLVILGAGMILNLTSPLEAILGTRQIIRFILLYFVVIQLRPSRLWVKNILIGLAVILMIQTALGFGQLIFGERMDTWLLPSERKTVGEIELTGGTDYFWDPGQRVFGTLGRYDRMGVFMAFVMLLIVGALYEWPKDHKYFQPAAIALGISLPILAMTYSRSAWFGFVLGVLFIGLAIKKDRRVAWAIASALAIVALYLAVSGLTVNSLIDLPGQSLAERFFEAFSMERWRGEYYGLGRLYWMVQTVVAVVPAAPLFGHGPASFGGGAVAALNNTGVYDQLGLPFGIYGTQGMIDNNWFSLWGETGTLGLAAFGWLLFGLFAVVRRVYKFSKSVETRALALGVMAATLAVVLNAFLATFFEIRTLGPYLWIMLAIVVSLGAEEKIDVSL